MREHTELLGRAGGPGGAPPVIAVGSPVTDFVTVTLDGEQVRRDLLTDPTLVAFFSPTCEPCKAKLPRFVEYAAAMPHGRASVLAVVVGEADQAEDFVSRLAPVARVVVENHDGPLSTAFQAEAYPTVLMIADDDQGRPVVRSNRVDLERPFAGAAPA
ncbi:TlpA disulfide reductase family protein [Streptomyces sp. NPDC001393]|uniref:TlpA disulfide reductase family protein n=1 Tax=Streptomyces sp. NPDC001852 TaxID=3364619 RepID=UPI0036C51888